MSFCRVESYMELLFSFNFYFEIRLYSNTLFYYYYYFFRIDNKLIIDLEIRLLILLLECLEIENIDLNIFWRIFSW